MIQFMSAHTTATLVQSRHPKLRPIMLICLWQATSMRVPCIQLNILNSDLQKLLALGVYAAYCYSAMICRTSLSANPCICASVSCPNTVTSSPVRFSSLQKLELRCWFNSCYPLNICNMIHKNYDGLIIFWKYLLGMLFSVMPERITIYDTTRRIHQHQKENSTDNMCMYLHFR